MSSPAPLQPDQLPPPDTLVALPNGYVTALMFYYADEEADLKAIADSQGFELGWRFTGGDELTEEVRKAWEHDGNLDLWAPDVPEGWQLGGKWDSEDGACAVFIRRKPAP